MSWVSGNYYLGLADMQSNAIEIYYYGLSQGWTLNAIAAMLGNMQSESSINPGIWESLVPYGGGYGLVQWTPYTKYSDWYGSGWQDNGPAELARIQYEAANNIQWFYNSEVGMSPPITFAEFLQSELDVATLARYFLWFYEHPADPGATQATRESQAAYWYEYLGGVAPPPGKVPIWLLFRMRGVKNAL